MNDGAPALKPVARRVALPLGEFKAPTTGWLVVVGRRGHYEFCDTTRAYNLATGAAFIHDSCSELILRPGGHVDRNATNKGRVERVSAGSIPVGNLREGVWMMLLRGEAEEAQLRAEYYPLPTGLTPNVTVRHDEGDFVGLGMWGNTGQTVLTWRWTPDKGEAFVGDLTWPHSSDAAESHTASLLGVAEAGMIDGCGRGRVPAVLVKTSRKIRNLNEVRDDAIIELDQDLQKAFDRWNTLPECRSGAR
jgi:hypothetical protein